MNDGSHEQWTHSSKMGADKGHLISKGLFAILEFFQKTNKTIWL